MQFASYSNFGLFATILQTNSKLHANHYYTYLWTCLVLKLQEIVTDQCEWQQNKCPCFSIRLLIFSYWKKNQYYIRIVLLTPNKCYKLQIITYSTLHYNKQPNGLILTYAPRESHIPFKFCGLFTCCNKSDYFFYFASCTIILEWCNTMPIICRFCKRFHYTER